MPRDSQDDEGPRIISRRDEIEDEALRECDRLLDKLVEKHSYLRTDRDVEDFYRQRGRLCWLRRRYGGR